MSVINMWKEAKKVQYSYFDIRKGDSLVAPKIFHILGAPILFSAIVYSALNFYNPFNFSYNKNQRRVQAGTDFFL